MTQAEIRDFLEQAMYVQDLLKESLVSQQYHEDALLNAIDIIDELKAMYECDMVYNRFQDMLEELRDEETDN